MVLFLFRECTFVSWGQHAHVSTSFRSHLLYFTRYRDCGDGVVEVTRAMHNGFGGDPITYTNMPWGAVRQSVLRDALTADSDGNLTIRPFPIPNWGSTEEVSQIRNLKTMGG